MEDPFVSKAMCNDRVVPILKKILLAEGEVFDKTAKSYCVRRTNTKNPYVCSYQVVV